MAREKSHETSTHEVVRAADTCRIGKVAQEHTGPLTSRGALPVRCWCTVGRVLEHWIHVYGVVAAADRSLEDWRWNYAFGVMQAADRFGDMASRYGHTAALARDSRMRKMAATTVGCDATDTKTDAGPAVG